MPEPDATPGACLVPVRRCDPAAVRLVCFPFGGGGASAFWSWPTDLPPGTDVWAVRLPGRETRFAEPFLTDAGAVVRELVPGLVSLPPARSAFYGHSLGAGLAFECANELRARGGRLPDLLVLSGRLPPHFPYTDDRSGAPDHEFIDHLRGLGGVPSEVLNSPAFRAVYLPRIRADYRLNASLPCRRSPALAVPITAVNGTGDPLVDAESVGAWREYTSVAFRSVWLDGDHFFIQAKFDVFIKVLATELRICQQGAPTE